MNSTRVGVIQYFSGGMPRYIVASRSYGFQSPQMMESTHVLPPAPKAKEAFSRSRLIECARGVDTHRIYRAEGWPVRRKLRKQMAVFLAILGVFPLKETKAILAERLVLEMGQLRETRSFPCRIIHVPM